jgi:predicted small integral membrane protein
MSRMDDATTPRSEQHHPTRWWQVVGSLPMAVAVVVAIEAVFILLVAVGNVTDYATNFAFVQHVLSMDTTNFGGRPGTGLDPEIMWRAITDPVAWSVAYVGIIVWESAAAILLLLATVLFVIGMVRGGFRAARAVASIGLLMIVVLFFGGFIAVGGEWFGMWRSTQWNGLDTAFRDGSLAGIGLILLHVPVAGWTRRSATVRA